MNINIKIREAKKISNKMIRVEMESFEVLKNKHKLKAVKDVKIYLNNNMFREERRIQYIIREKTTEQKESARVYQKVIINETVEMECHKSISDKSNGN